MVYDTKYSHLLESCALCPHKCRINRFKSSKGFCRASGDLEISTFLPHYGEEPPVSGNKGSGTIFFKHCNMHCVYCQNYQISQEYGSLALKNDPIVKLEDCMLALQALGCHNINLVSPTIWVPHILDALSAIKSKEDGLKIPVVYNSGGYEDPMTIKMLEGFVEIYMPDIRYSENETSYRYSGINNYVENNRKSLLEMYRQVGRLKTDKNGIAVHGLMIRLLILPGNADEVKKSLDFIKSELSTDVYISIMSQYAPLYKASSHPEINRLINRDEYNRIVDYADKLGFYNGAIQEFEEHIEEKDLFKPDFESDAVFKYKK
jgi:putative pyruvate formate lyase activating enzyme